MTKTYLLDTNILMSHPDAIYGFDDNNVVITGTTLEELSHLKEGAGERAAQARAAIRQLKKIRLEAAKDKLMLSEGVPINQGRGQFRIENDCIDANVLPQGWSIDLADNKIISAAKKLGAILVTEDEGMSIKAQDINIAVQSYRNAEISLDDNYTGRTEIYNRQHN
jgi:PhoH-like ATPase